VLLSLPEKSGLVEGERFLVSASPPGHHLALCQRWRILWHFNEYENMKSLLRSTESAPALG
jgi:hypothetical protein